MMNLALVFSVVLKPNSIYYLIKQFSISSYMYTKNINPSNSALKPKSAQFLQLHYNQLHLQNWVWRPVQNNCGIIKKAWKDMKVCWKLALKKKKSNDTYKPILCNITLSLLKYTQLKTKLCFHMQKQMWVLLILLSSQFQCISEILSVFRFFWVILIC